MRDALIWNGTIGFFNESYIVVCLSCFVNILSIKETSTFGEYFSLANAFLLVIVVIGYPIVVLVVLTKN